jgi:hypothetical protein
VRHFEESSVVAYEQLVIGLHKYLVGEERPCSTTENPE